ncbi:MAG: hypothetical protein K9M03_01205 [Kiritimatiellales bacterium]|nr:hypothetical protein [Kiritimatiellales bacterium]
MSPEVPELGSRDLDEVTFGVGTIELPDPQDELIKFIVGRHDAQSQVQGKDHYAFYAKPVMWHANIAEAFDCEISAVIGGARCAITRNSHLYFSDYSDALGAIPPIVIQRFFPSIREHLSQIVNLESVKIALDPIDLKYTHPIWMTFTQVVEDLKQMLGESSREYRHAVRQFETWQEEMRKEK